MCLGAVAVVVGGGICFGAGVLICLIELGDVIGMEAMLAVGEVIVAFEEVAPLVGKLIEAIALVGEVTVTLGILRESLAARPGSFGIGGVSAEDALIASRRSRTSL